MSKNEIASKALGKYREPRSRHMIRNKQIQLEAARYRTC